MRTHSYVYIYAYMHLQNVFVFVYIYLCAVSCQGTPSDASIYVYRYINVYRYIKTIIHSDASIYVYRYIKTIICTFVYVDISKTYMCLCINMYAVSSKGTSGNTFIYIQIYQIHLHTNVLIYTSIHKMYLYVWIHAYQHNLFVCVYIYRCCIKQKCIQNSFSYKYKYTQITGIYLCVYVYICTANPTWGYIFKCCFKDQSSWLERLFCHVSVKRAVRALSFEL